MKPTESSTDLRNIPIASIQHDDQGNRSAQGNGEAHAEMVASIRACGLLQPIVVCAVASEGKKPGGFRVLAGRRRLAACRELEHERIDALVLPVEVNAETALVVEAVENMHRRDLSPMDESALFIRMHEKLKLPIDGIAKRVERSPSYVYDRMRLADLIEPAKKLLAGLKITAAHAVILSRLAPAVQKQLIAHGSGIGQTGALWTMDSGVLWGEREKKGADPHLGLKPVSVRELQSWVDKHVRLDPTAPDTVALFPHVADAEIEAKATDGNEFRLVPITMEQHVLPEAKGEERTIGPSCWKRIKELCPRDRVKGFIAAGQHRGEVFPICVDKKGCTKHWGVEIKASQKAAKDRAKGRDEAVERREAARRQVEERERALENHVRKAWEEAKDEICAVVGKAVERMTPARLVAFVQDIESRVAASKAIPVARGKDYAGAVRRVAFLLTMDQAFHYTAHREFPKLAKKAVGADLSKLVERITAEAKAAAKPEPVEKEAVPRGKRAAR